MNEIQKKKTKGIVKLVWKKKIYSIYEEVTECSMITNQEAVRAASIGLFHNFVRDFFGGTFVLFLCLLFVVV